MVTEICRGKPGNVGVALEGVLSHMCCGKLLWETNQITKHRFALHWCTQIAQQIKWYLNSTRIIYSHPAHQLEYKYKEMVLSWIITCDTKSSFLLSSSLIRDINKIINSHREMLLEHKT